MQSLCLLKDKNLGEKKHLEGLLFKNQNTEIFSSFFFFFVKFYIENNFMDNTKDSPGRMNLDSQLNERK